MKIIEGYLNTPKGFRAAGAHIGIKKSKKDICLIASDVPAAVAGCFTKNIVKAAPVTWDMDIVASGGMTRGVLVNSGNANACTGTRGAEDNGEMAALFAETIGAEAREILVCSTGVIGVNLPMDVIRPGIKSTAVMLGYSSSSGRDAAEAIMTTDTFMKTVTVSIEVGGKTVTLSGMAKGSGMIHPNMATLLAFVTTDCAISASMLRRALTRAVDKTFNMISVDGDTSTNDTLLALANGMAENEPINNEGEDYFIFAEALCHVCRKLAIDIARDGEGASKLIEASVNGAKSVRDAEILAKGVVSSNLFKAAVFGADANWGRAMCAMGYSGGEFDPQNASVGFSSAAGRISLFEHGSPLVFDEALAKQILSEKEIKVEITLYEGSGAATAWGCDLTYDYVKINGDYRS